MKLKYSIGRRLYSNGLLMLRVISLFFIIPFTNDIGQTSEQTEAYLFSDTTEPVHKIELITSKHKLFTIFHFSYHHSMRLKLGFEIT